MLSHVVYLYLKIRGIKNILVVRFLSSIIVLLIVAQSVIVEGQVFENKYDMRAPLNIPMVFAGNFGELRQTHFHSGVDFKTNGREGYRVYASEDGYVSRLLVSASGYGNAVYVTHPNGLLTVYGHLSRFNKEIAKYVKDLQYKNESWAIDVNLPKGVLKVSRGDKLGLSGNSGSSMGPHLHYEIRDAKTEDVINPFLFFRIKDKIRPKISSLCVYDLTRFDRYYDIEPRRYELIERGRGFYSLKDTVVVPSKVGFGLHVDDFLNGSWNKCGVYTIKMYIDNELLYNVEMDRFSFVDSREINVLKDMKSDLLYSDKIYKTWLPCSCAFDGLKCSLGDGILIAEKGKEYNVRLEVADYAGNRSGVSFVAKVDVRGKEDTSFCDGVLVSESSRKLFRIGGMQVDFGESSVYGDIRLDTAKYVSDDSLLFAPEVYRVGSEYIPLKKKVELSFKVGVSGVKGLFVVRKENNGDFCYVGGEYSNGFLKVRVSRLGDFALRKDTVSPVLVPLYDYNRKWLQQYSVLRFKVNDEESLVSSYRAELDGNWVWSYYDDDKSQIVCYVDKTRSNVKGLVDFVIKVKDVCGNESVFSRKFYL